MRNRVVFSITDVTGPRHLQVRKSVLWIALTLSMLLLGSIPVLLTVAGTLQIDRNNLSHVLEKLRGEKRMFLYESKHLQAEIQRIQETLDSMDSLTNALSGADLPPSRRLLNAANYMADREHEFQVLEARIGRIESILGDERGADENLQRRVAAAGLNAELKKAVLDSIPSGSPVPMRGITSGYGRRPHPLTGKEEFHRGADLRAPVGTPVRAPADGVVEYAGLHRKSGLGNLLIIRHNFGFSTTFGHLDKIYVKSGAVVHKGQKVALTGNTGLSNGPHLHYEIHYVYRHMDPAPFLTWGINSWDEIFSRIQQVDWDSILALIQLRHPPAAQKSLQLAKLEGTL
jgi:murein DD-endopeptidase MepM/ murein hydrolase activator NlpD